MSQNGYAHNTVTSHVSAISYFNKINEHFDATQSFIIKRMLTGLNKLQSRKDTRLPISINMLGKIIPNLYQVCTSRYEAHLYSVAFSLAFSALLRISELTLPNSHSTVSALQFSDVLVAPSHVKIFIRSSKNDQYQNGAEIIIKFMEDNKILQDSLSNYLVCRPKCNGTFLCHFDGSPVTAFQFNSILKKVLEFSGIQNTFYKSHSFRIGGATYLHSIGKSDEEIKLLGRWKSNAFKSYIRLQIPY